MALSDHEKQTLDDLARRLAADDPRFRRRVQPGLPGGTRTHRAIAVGGLVLGLLLLALFCTTTNVLVGIASFIVLLASLHLLWRLTSQQVERALANVSAATRQKRAGRRWRRRRSA
jgi:hypothetical protein